MKIRSLFFLTIIAAVLGMLIACEDSDKSVSTDSGKDTSGKDTYYTVRFEANGGSPAPQDQTVSPGGTVSEPAYMSKEGYLFEGWYKEVAFINLWNFNSDTVTRHITLYARWGLIVQGTTLTEKFQWLNSNAESDNIYIIEVSKDELLGPQNLSFDGKYNISIQLIGIGGEKTIELYGSGPLFTVENNATLILNENIVLEGDIFVLGGGLIMNNNSKINSTVAVHIHSASTYSTQYRGTFTMNGGEISSANGGHASSVYVEGGTFTMNGGTISTNGVDVHGGILWGWSPFEGTFTMNGGKISGSYDRGVNISKGTFTMTGGEISGNAGGVYISNGTFTMTGGEISGNTVYDESNSDLYGGGVYVDSNSSFEKTGGIITGYSSDTENGNVVKYYYGVLDDDIIINILDNHGHAVHVDHNDSRFVRRKETTAGQGDNLIYIRNEPNPPTISGAWDE